MDKEIGSNYFRRKSWSAYLDRSAVDEANWICENQRPDTWRSGGAEIAGNKLSSFDFMDEILRRLARKKAFPNLKTIVIAGHSAGGQFVIRYEMLNGVHDKLGIPVSYVVANPSSYAYVDSLRPTTSAFPATGSATAQNAPVTSSSNPTPTFVPFADAKNCTGYDIWPYGLKGRTGYASALTEEQITKQLVARQVTYLLGEADVLPLGVFDTSTAGPTGLRAAALSCSRLDLDARLLGLGPRLRILLGARHLGPGS